MVYPSSSATAGEASTRPSTSIDRFDSAWGVVVLVTPAVSPIDQAAAGAKVTAVALDRYRVGPRERSSATVRGRAAFSARAGPTPTARRMAGPATNHNRMPP